MKWYCDRCYEKVPRNTTKCPICGFTHFVKERERIDLRDFFAGCALINDKGQRMSSNGPIWLSEERRVKEAYEMADAMMREREK